MYLNLFKDKWGVIASYMQHYKINGSIHYFYFFNKIK